MQRIMWIPPLNRGLRLTETPWPTWEPRRWYRPWRRPATEVRYQVSELYRDPDGVERVGPPLFTSIRRATAYAWMLGYRAGAIAHWAGGRRVAS